MQPILPSFPYPIVSLKAFGIKQTKQFMYYMFHCIMHAEQKLNNSEDNMK